MTTNKNNTVLIVEDNEDLRKNLTESLAIQHNVRSAENGSVALEMLKTESPDLILLDIMLPFPLDGFSILRHLKNEPRLSLIPVILVSGLKSDQIIMDGLKLGANDFIVKPFKLNELLLKCNNLINIKNNLKQSFEREVYLKIPNSVELDVEAEFKKKFESVVENFIEGSQNSVPLIAEKMLMSVSTLERWTRRLYNTTPKQFILNLKLNKAEIYLRQRLGSVNEIAYNLGFNSVSYFCVCFKKKYGKTPKTMMRSAAGEKNNKAAEPEMSYIQ